MDLVSDLKFGEHALQPLTSIRAQHMDRLEFNKDIQNLDSIEIDLDQSTAENMYNMLAKQCDVYYANTIKNLKEVVPQMVDHFLIYTGAKAVRQTFELGLDTLYQP